LALVPSLYLIDNPLPLFANANLYSFKVLVIDTVQIRIFIWSFAIFIFDFLEIDLIVFHLQYFGEFCNVFTTVWKGIDGILRGLASH
jgi:hypothetical protein